MARRGAASSAEGEDWDAPFFKVLARNDSGEASSHQSGIVLPKDLRNFLPALSTAKVSEQAPTSDRSLSVELLDGYDFLGDATVRYQFQTWGGKRKPESRITDNLAPLLSLSREGDILIFQRRSDSLNRFRLILVRKNTALYPKVAALVDGRRWGVLRPSRVPVSQSQVQEADRQLRKLAEHPFEVHKERKSRESRIVRIVRSSIFPQRVIAQYHQRCCVSGMGLRTPSGLREVEAAHVIPVSDHGPDDLRNGIALTQTLHWAFDCGLFGITPGERRVYVPKRVSSYEGNKFLKVLQGRRISEATPATVRVHDDALEWHMLNRVDTWR